MLGIAGLLSARSPVSRRCSRTRRQHIPSARRASPNKFILSDLMGGTTEAEGIGVTSKGRAVRLFAFRRWLTMTLRLTSIIRHLWRNVSGRTRYTIRARRWQRKIVRWMKRSRASRYSGARL